MPRRQAASSRPAGRRPRAKLPDHLRPGLRVLFVGINPGLRSAQTGHHYAGRGNRFWKLMCESGLLPEPLDAERDAEVLRWGYGLTNIVARPTSGVAELTARDFERGRRELLAKIRGVRPDIVALVGLSVFDRLQGSLPASATKQRLGLQAQRLHEARVFVLPNPSGRNTHFTYAEMLAWFRKLSRFVRRLPRGDGATASEATPTSAQPSSKPRRSRAPQRR